MTSPTGLRDVEVDRDSFAVEDELALAELDSRFTPLPRQVRIDGDHARTCHLLVRRVSSLSADLRASLRLNGEGDESVLLIAGGVATGRSALVVPPGIHRDKGIRLILEDGMALTREHGARPVLISATWEVSRAAEALGLLMTRTTQASFLSTGGHLTVDSFLNSLPRKPRQVWRRDERVAIAIGASTERVPLGPDEIAHAAPMVTSVAEGNGMRQPARASEWALASLSDRPGEVIALRTTCGNETVGFTFCRQYGRYLNVHTVGVHAHFASRRDVYHIVTYLAPLRFAIEHRLLLLGFGTDHPKPKLLRGCVQEPLFSSVTPAS